MFEDLNWTVINNYAAGEPCYQVCRRRTMAEPVHCGNLEFSEGIFGTAAEAQALADRLNEES